MMKPFALSLVLAAAALANDWGRKPEHVKVEPVKAVSVKPGTTAIAEVHFRVASGFHINSSKPTSDLLIPTVLTLNTGGGVKIGKIVYPPGHDFTLKLSPNEKLNVYSGAVTLKVPINASARAQTGSTTITGELKYQACDDASCYPPKKVPIEIPINIER